MSSNDKNKIKNILEFESDSFFHKDSGSAQLALALQDTGSESSADRN